MARREYRYVKSSNVQGVAYDKGQSALYVQFTNGSEYMYHDVPEDEYESLLASLSPGAYMNDFIKGTYRYDKV